MSEAVPEAAGLRPVTRQVARARGAGYIEATVRAGRESGAERSVRSGYEGTVVDFGPAGVQLEDNLRRLRASARTGGLESIGRGEVEKLGRSADDRIVVR